ncbi:beta-1,3-glucanase family protein [Streptomyces sp. NPDC058579]|uniref:beta-1,3-glucanase family protein n=1 Tax=Streptomyces sp. NPDC058579 TaxID=3346548 RepID=UPI0036626FEC
MLSRRKLLGASALTLAAAAFTARPAYVAAAATGLTLDIDLVNNTGSDTVFAYVSGLALDRGNAWMLLGSDGRTPYYPESPGSPGAQLGADCAIPLGPSGSGPRRITVPRLAGARIWFSVDAPLDFRLNPGPTLVEPAVSNPSDPNIATQWSFAEFTFNDAVVYANVSAVDFVSLPVELHLTTTSGALQRVPGLRPGSVDSIAQGLRAQSAADGLPWDRLVVSSGGRNLRVLHPSQRIAADPGFLTGYYDSYVDQVWSKYGQTDLIVNTQAQWGELRGRVTGERLDFPGHGSFGRPSTADIFSCSTGPFAVTTPAMGALAARISAAFNRSTLLAIDRLPEGENPAGYYTTSPTNHYARLVHAHTGEGRGYAFPYDDVTPTDGADQSGFVTAGDPTLLTVSLGPLGGGEGASAGLPTGQWLSLRVTNRGLTDRYVCHSGGLGFAEVVDAGSEAPLREDATWRIVPGLAGTGGYSFESRNHPGEFLRHWNSRVHRDPNDGSGLFQLDATWFATEAPGGFRLTSANYPDRYLRHRSAELWLADPGGPNEWDGGDTFEADTTWAVARPWAD